MNEKEIKLATIRCKETALNPRGEGIPPYIEKRIVSIGLKDHYRHSVYNGQENAHFLGQRVLVPTRNFGQFERNAYCRWLYMPDLDEAACFYEVYLK